MKTAEELNRKYHPLCYLLNFEKALAEHDSEIISKIEEMIDNTKQAMSGRRLTQQALGSFNMLILKLNKLLIFIKEK